MQTQAREVEATTVPAQRGAPVFIVGAARSGTSLLYKTLCLHPDVTYISNWVAKFPRVPQLALLNRVARRATDRRRDVWFSGGSNAYVYGSKRSLSGKLFPMAVEGEPLFRACGVAEFPWQEGVGRDVEVANLRRSVARLQRAAGGSTFVSKRIANNRRIPLLAEAFPDARFVEIVRDGRAVAYSLSRVDWWMDSPVSWYGGTPLEWEAEGRDPWEICARNWVEELKDLSNGLRHVPPEKVMRLKYETLVEDPVQRVEDIATFCGMAADSGWSSTLRTLGFPNRNEGWRQKLEPETIERISSIQKDELSAHGYI